MKFEWHLKAIQQNIEVCSHMPVDYRGVKESSNSLRKSEHFAQLWQYRCHPIEAQSTEEVER